LKKNLRKLKLEDEVLQPSKNEEIARKLVESNVKVLNGRYEIPVPLKTDVADKLPNSYNNVLNRTLMLYKKALKNDELKCILVDTFRELIGEGWLVPESGPISNQEKCWYLPFFILFLDRRNLELFLMTLFCC